MGVGTKISGGNNSFLEYHPYNLTRFGEETGKGLSIYSQQAVLPIVLLAELSCLVDSGLIDTEGVWQASSQNNTGEQEE
jgi:hypothetical protein